MNDHTFDVIIIGGSYSGLAAGMALGRALRTVLIIDSGKPCNSQTPHAHNFITQDGKTPAEISSIAKEQVAAYKTVQFHKGLATKGSKIENGFEIQTDAGDKFAAKKILVATGIKDLMPAVKGFAECWGISVIHCPYCHGYEVRDQKTGVFGNGDYGFEFSKLISNWTKDLTLFTNGKSTLTEEQFAKLKKNNIPIVEKEVDYFEQQHGKIQAIVFKDGTKNPVNALYAKPDFEQHCDIPKQLGCEFTDDNYIKIDGFQKTNVEGVFASGDSTTPMRTVSLAVSSGTFAGVVASKEIIGDEFNG